MGEVAGVWVITGIGVRINPVFAERVSFVRGRGLYPDPGTPQSEPGNPGLSTDPVQTPATNGVRINPVFADLPRSRLAEPHFFLTDSRLQ